MYAGLVTERIRTEKEAQLLMTVSNTAIYPLVKYPSTIHRLSLNE